MQSVVINGEAQIAFLKEYQMNKSILDPEIRKLVENSSNYTHRERTETIDKYASIRPIIDKIAANYSAIIAPSVQDEAPIGLGDMGSATFNTLWTASTLSSPASPLSFLANNATQRFHMPVINVPAFAGAHGMPIGISLVAGRFCDQHLLRITKVLSEPLMAEGGWQQSL
jgi:Asp-tRNA(Asn)/Glu-tRNA(Gln) amidotransferase A subunit family amidase